MGRDNTRNTLLVKAHSRLNLRLFRVASFLWVYRKVIARFSFSLSTSIYLFLSLKEDSSRFYESALVQWSGIRTITLTVTLDAFTRLWYPIRKRLLGYYKHSSNSSTQVSDVTNPSHYHNWVTHVEKNEQMSFTLTQHNWNSLRNS
jgi:hypothetical protein